MARGPLNSRAGWEAVRTAQGPSGRPYNQPSGGNARTLPENNGKVQEISVNQKLKQKLDRAFRLSRDLVNHLDETALSLDLPNLPSNQIAGQLWCLVGARESYTQAIEAGGWQGFSCSLKTPRLKPSVLAALETTHKHINEIDFANLTDVQIELAFDLLEHEIQHHGQLIRFIYGNGLTFPDSWHKRYTV
jgi:hypothetical protein